MKIEEELFKKHFHQGDSLDMLLTFEDALNVAKDFAAQESERANEELKEDNEFKSFRLEGLENKLKLWNDTIEMLESKLSAAEKLFLEKSERVNAQLKEAQKASENQYITISNFHSVMKKHFTCYPNSENLDEQITLIKSHLSELKEENREALSLLLDSVDKKTFIELKQKLSAAEQALETEAILEWLTSKNSKYAIMYGGTPELEKDYRFASTDRDFTIKEIIDLYKTHDKTI